MQNYKIKIDFRLVAGVFFCANSFGGTLTTVTGSAGFSDLNTGYHCNYSQTWNDSDEAAQEAITNAKEQCHSEVKRISTWKLVRLSCFEWANYTLSAGFQCAAEPEG